MKSNIFIPKRLKVGFQNREDTYTKKLAYVIYYDEKNNLRKEASWNSWRNEKIDPLELNNSPISGFVLNKKVGDYSSGWSHRQGYIRIYDPRDFEFEITVENLIYILENTSSIKGKGLEGEFVYGWDGKDLVLIPTNSPDYIEISQYNEIVHRKNYIKSKDLILGATYKTKSNEEWIYMGRFDYWAVNYNREKVENSTGYYWDRYSYKTIKTDVNKGKYFYFTREEKYSWKNETHLKLLTLKSLGEKFIDTVSSDCTHNYAELFDKLECMTEYSPYDEDKDEYVEYTVKNLKDYVKEKMKSKWDRDFEIKFLKGGCYEYKTIYLDKDNNLYYDKKYNNDIKNYTYCDQTTVEDIIEKYHPVYKNEYLENGKLYRRLKTW